MSNASNASFLFTCLAKFLAERNLARHVDKNEALDVLDKSEKAGLVHCSTNSKENAGVICNCCSCCCTLLRGRLEFGFPNTFSPSRFTAFSDSAKCTGCGTCKNKRCPAKAIELVDKKAVVDENKCIGCGLCVTECKTSAMKLNDRKTVSEIPNDAKELVFKVLKEKGKFDAFMKNLKR
jgi:ferredoxin